MEMDQRRVKWWRSERGSLFRTSSTQCITHAYTHHMNHGPCKALLLRYRPHSSAGTCTKSDDVLQCATQLHPSRVGGHLCVEGAAAEQVGHLLSYPQVISSDSSLRIGIRGDYMVASRTVCTCTRYNLRHVAHRPAVQHLSYHPWLHWLP